MATSNAYVALPQEGSGNQPPKSSTMATCVLNLVKVIVGAGVFALPAGVAAFSDEPADGLAFALAAMAALCCISAYCFWLIGRACVLTGRDTYSSAFGQIFGEERACVVAVCSIVFCGSVCMMYCVIIGDTCYALAEASGLKGPMGRRGVLLSLVGLFVLLPISLLRSLSALAPLSALGVLGVAFTAVFCAIRFIQGAYSPGGRFFSEAPFEPSFSRAGTQALPAFVLISMLATTFISHFSAPRFFRELERPTLPRFAMLTGYGFVGSFAIMSVLMCFGFLTFGGACQGLILSNYATSDQLAIVSRIGVLVSVVFSFPFLLAACRDDLLELLLQGAPPKPWKTATTVALVAASTAVGVVLTDLGFLVAIIGAVLATLLIYVFPPAMALGHFAPRVRAGHASLGEVLEYRLNQALLALGILFAFLGATVTVLKTFWPSVLKA